MDIIPPARDALGRILPGNSLNPQGRPTLPAEVRAVLQAGSQRAAERLVELIEADDLRVAAAAASAVLDRLYGKPSQAIDAHVKQEQVSVAQAHLSALLEINQRRAERLAAEQKVIEG
jgi:hypothetical protein